MIIAIETELGRLTEDQRRQLTRRRPSDEPGLRRSVAALIDRVRAQGDKALFEMALDLDRVELSQLEVPKKEWKAAYKALSPDIREALERARRNIERFHQAQIPEDLEVEVEPGVTLGRRFVPVGRVGVYAPGGRAAYPSSVLMGVVPARAAGVREVILCSPPGPSGRPPSEVMAAAHIAGADRLFMLGGAGAIAALAFGTQSVPAVSTIVGPGNKWVTEAKRQVAGEVVIDAPAGPSEVLVLADEGANPMWIALELLAQAEHDPEAAVVALVPSPELAIRVRGELSKCVAESPRNVIVEEALKTRGAILWSNSVDDRIDFAQEYAAEHLALMVDDSGEWLPRLTTSGTVFLGQRSSVAFGDYMTGANHVLPTAGRSASFSGLSTLDFLRSYTVQHLSDDAARAMAEDVGLLADSERLPGHAAAARARGVDS